MNARTLLIASVLAASAAVTGCNCGPTPTGTTLAFSTQPQGAQAGVPFTPAVTVSILDANGNVATNVTAQVTIALQDNPGGGTLGGTLTQTAVEGVATFSDLNLTKAAAGYTLKATSSGLTDAISDPFSISPGPPASLAFIQAPTDAASGSVLAPPVTVSLLDAFGNQTAAAAPVTIAIGTGPAGAVLGGTTAVTSAAGVATFSGLTLDLEGAYTLTATSGSLPVVTSPPFTIHPGVPATMSFTVQPTSTTAGTPIAPAVQVTLLDSRGNVARGASDAVTLSLGSNPGSATLSGTLTKNAVNGVATFSDLSLNKAGTGYTLAASSGALPAATSSAFDVSAAAPSTLAFAVQPSSSSAGTAIAPAVQVAILDAFGNRTSSTAAVTVALGNNPGGATLSGTLTQNAVAGTATFSNLSLDKVGTGYTLQASAAGLASATSAGFDVVSSATPTQLSFRVQPSSADAGAPIAPAVEVLLLDAFGNRTSSTAAVTVAIGTNPGSGTLSGTRTVSAVAGLATFADLSIDKAGTGYTLTAASTGLPTIISSTFDIRPGPAAALVYRQQPANAAAGALLSPPVQVAIVDALGNQTGSTAAVTLAIATGPSGATLGGTTTQAAVAGLATFANLSITTAGTYTLSASSSGLPSATSNAFTISAAAASRLVFTVQPSNATAATTIAPAVQVSIQDGFGNVVTTSTANVTAAIGTNPSGGTLSGTLTRAAVAGVATFSDLSVDKAGTGYTLQAASAGLTSATSSAFDIIAGPATRLAFTVQPSNTAAGGAITPAVQVSITDAGGNVVTTSSATVTVAIGNNPSGGTLSGSTVIAANNGVATFSGLSIDRAGTGYTLTAASAGLTSATSTAFNITSGTLATRVVFTVQPSNATAGAAIAPAVKVAITDVFGNVVITSTANVTVAIGNNPGGGTLGGTTTVAAVAGIATFSTLTIDKAGIGYTLTAASPGLAGATSLAFNISAGAAAALSYRQQPSNATAGTAITPAVTVAIVDAFGNQTASTATVAVAIGTNPGGGTLSGTTSAAAVAGVATFSNLSINKAGTGYTLNATSAGLASATSSAFNITAGAASALAFQQQPTSAAAGASISPAVTAAVVDAQGNVVTSSTANVTVAIGNNPGGGTLSGTLTQAAAGGVATFANLSINKVGAGYTLAAASAGLTGATSNAFTITAAGADHLAFAVPVPNTTAGAGIAPAVQVAVLDAFGNVVTSATASVTVAIGNNPGGGTLGGTKTVAAVSGVATFTTLTIDKAGIGYTLVATSPGLISGTSNAFNVTAAAPSQLAFTVQPSSATAGAAIAPALQVSILDAFGNVGGTFSGSVTVALANNPGGGTLSGTLTQSAVNGVASFNDLSINRTGAGYTLTATSAGLPSATSSAFNIAAGAAAKLAFGQPPSNTGVGAAISPAVTVLVQDALGNTATASTASVTMAIANNPGGGTLSGTTTVAAVSGVAIFSNLSINAAGTGYTLQATSPPLTPATSPPFDITNGVAGLSYTDPPAGGKIRLVKNAASTASTVVLDLVAAVPLTGFQVGFNLPLDTTRVQANATLQTPGTALPAGSAPIAAKAVIPATGPLANVLVSGQSQKAAGAGAVPGNSAVPAGGVFYQLRLDLKAGAAAGTVFDGAALGPLFSGNMRDRAGTDVAVPADFAIGKLVVN